MAGTKRSRPEPGQNANRGQAPKATVFRKSAKKQKTEPPSPAAKPKPAPQPQRTRPKDQPKPKTKHEFIKVKQEAARKEKEAAATEEKRNAQKSKTKTSAKQAGAVPTTLIITPPPPTSSFTLIAGSYERILYGLNANIDSDSQDQLTVTLKPTFTFPAHVSSIRTVATAGPSSKWLATGGTDEVVKVWDLRQRREVGQLTGHEGTITSLVFASKTYLLTTSADSNINLYRTRDWSLLRTLKGHIGRINSAAPHPTGRLALSVGSDRTIRMWDLMRGRAAASTRIGIEADLVRWDTKGTRFVVLAYRQAMIFKTDMTKVAEVDDKRRIGDVQFARVKVPGTDEEHELLFVALEDGIVKIYDLDAKVERSKKEDKAEDEVSEDEEDELTLLVEVGRLVGHSNRVKAVTVLPVLVPESNGKGKAKASTTSTHFASTISSDGFIRVFDLTAICAGLSSDPVEVVEVSSIGQFDTKGTRLTCLSAVGILVSKSEEDEEEAGEDIIESDNDEVVDEAAEDEELKQLEEALKAAQGQGLKLEDLEELIDASDVEFESDDDDNDDDVDGDLEDDENEEGDEEEEEEE